MSYSRIYLIREVEHSHREVTKVHVLKTVLLQVNSFLVLALKKRARVSFKPYHIHQLHIVNAHIEELNIISIFSDHYQRESFIFPKRLGRNWLFLAFLLILSFFHLYPERQGAVIWFPSEGHRRRPPAEPTCYMLHWRHSKGDGRIGSLVPMLPPSVRPAGDTQWPLYLWTTA